MKKLMQDAGMSTIQAGGELVCAFMDGKQAAQRFTTSKKMDCYCR
jgi:hypothetical protein